MIYVLLQTEWQLFILSVMVLGLILFKKWNWAQWIGIFSMSYLILLCKTPIVDSWLEKLENKYPPLEATQLEPSLKYYIVVLGSGGVYDPDIPANSWLDPVLASRFLEGLKWKSQLPNSTLIGMANSLESSISQAEMVTKASLLYKVPPSDTLQIPQPTRTKEEASFLYKRIGGQKIILTTSSFHMPRAKKWFEKEGFNVIPAPTDYRIKKDPKGAQRSWAWNWDRIDYWNILLHEWAGELHFWLLSGS